MTDDNIKYMRRRQAVGYLRDRGLPVAEATLAKLASVGGGPAFRRFVRFPVYTSDQLEIWAAARLSRLVNNTTEADAATGDSGKKTKPHRGLSHPGSASGEPVNSATEPDEGPST